MNRILFLIFILIVSLSLTACGDDSKSDDVARDSMQQEETEDDEYKWGVTIIPDEEDLEQYDKLKDTLNDYNESSEERQDEIDKIMNEE